MVSPAQKNANVMGSLRVDGTNAGGVGLTSPITSKDGDILGTTVSHPLDGTYIIALSRPIDPSRLRVFVSPEYDAVLPSPRCVVDTSQAGSATPTITVVFS